MKAPMLNTSALWELLKWFSIPSHQWICLLLIVGVVLCISLPLGTGGRGKVIVELGGLSWTREDFCRGWLITGDTGSGKTRSGITPLMFQIFKNEPTWGGVCIDDKGLYWEMISAMAVHFQRAEDLVLLQVKPEYAAPDWRPSHLFNLLGDRSIPSSTYAKFVVDTASSLGQRGEKAFFKNQAQTHIAKSIETLEAIGGEVTMQNVYNMLLLAEDMNEVLQRLREQTSAPRHGDLLSHFENRFLNQPAEQLGGVKETIANYLQPFVVPEISAVFGSGVSTFDFATIDKGKIVCVAMPQKFQTERRYINTFLKMLFYTHVLRRFDKPSEARLQDNLLILWADEAQRFMTASEDGMSDYNSVDVIREARGAVVAAAQSSTSFLPPLGRDKAKVLTLNLRNRMIFRAADEDGALESADFLGRKRVVKRTWGFSNGKRTAHFSEAEEHKIKPHILRQLARHECVLVHPERGFRKKFVPPIEADGSVCSWFRRRWW